MKAIPFFDSGIRIIPHSATQEKHLSRVVSIEDFANGEPVSLYENENGELLCRNQNNDRFIEGVWLGKMMATSYLKKLDIVYKVDCGTILSIHDTPTRCDEELQSYYRGKPKNHPDDRLMAQVSVPSHISNEIVIGSKITDWR